MRKGTVWLLVGLLWVLPSMGSLAQGTHTVTLASAQEVAVGYHDGLDQKIAYGPADDGLRFGNYIAPDPRPGDARFRTYIQFDLGALPAGATIQQATLSMYVYDRRFPDGGALDVGAHQVTSGWTQAGLMNTANWTWGSLPAFQSTPVATAHVDAMGQWYSWDVTSLAAGWQSGAQPNLGLMLCETPLGSANQGVGARSRDGSRPDLGPRLVVTYAGSPPPPPTPAPVEILPTLTKWASPTEATPGEEVTYSIRASNQGRDAAIDVIITDVVPDELEILSASTSQGTVTVAGQTVSADVGVIGHGFAVEVVIHTRVREDVPGPLQITNVAYFKSPNGGELTTDPVVVTVPGLRLPRTGHEGARWGVVLALAVGLLAVIVELMERRSTVR